jgi:hypothetical protein
MARKKTPREAAPESWKGAVEASAELDAKGEDKDKDKSGVEYDEDGYPTYIEALSPEERALAGEHLASKMRELAAIEQDQLETAAKFRKDVKARKKLINELRDEVLSGTRKKPAQQNLLEHAGKNGAAAAQAEG